MAGPRRTADILADGVSRWQLRQHEWRPVLRGVRLRRTEELDRLTLIRVVALTLPAGGVLGGRTAAWLRGVDLLRTDGPVDVVLPRDTPYAPRQGVLVRRALLADEDREEANGLQVTVPVRTAFDLARLEPLVEAVVCLDAMLHQHLSTVDEIRRYAAGCAGWRGVRRASTALDHADAGAKSPMESRLRMALVQAGLPRPVVNQPLHDRHGAFLARPDLRLGHVLIEYDGDVHRDRDQFARDADRQNRLVGAGYTVLRCTSAQLRAPATLITQIRVALAHPPSHPPILR